VTATATPTPSPERSIITRTTGYVGFDKNALDIYSLSLATGTTVKPTVSSDGKYTVYEGLVQATWTSDKGAQVTGFVDAKAIGITSADLDKAQKLTYKDNPLGFAPVPSGAIPGEADQWLSNPKNFHSQDVEKEPYRCAASGRYAGSYVDEQGVLNVEVNIQPDPKKPAEIKTIKMLVSKSEPVGSTTYRGNKNNTRVDILRSTDSFSVKLALDYYYNTQGPAGIFAFITTEKNRIDNGKSQFIVFRDYL
jgi:hypothetical protein